MYRDMRHQYKSVKAADIATLLVQVSDQLVPILQAYLVQQNMGTYDLRDKIRDNVIRSIDVLAGMMIDYANKSKDGRVKKTFKAAFAILDALAEWIDNTQNFIPKEDVERAKVFLSEASSRIKKKAGSKMPKLRRGAT